MPCCKLTVHFPETRQTNLYLFYMSAKRIGENKAMFCSNITFISSLLCFLAHGNFLQLSFTIWVLYRGIEFHRNPTIWTSMEPFRIWDFS